MAKRRAEDTVVTSPSSKRCRGLCGVDLRMESIAPSGGVNPPSLLALLGSRCRKRPFYFEETNETDLDLALFRKASPCDLLKHTAHLNTTQLQSARNFQEPRVSAAMKSTNKRAREDSEAPADKDKPKDTVKVDSQTTDDGDRSYNTFWFWRTPLPELDMSLLQEPPEKNPSDAMDT